MTPQLAETVLFFVAATRRARHPYLHEVVLGQSVWYPTDFVVGLEDVVVNLKFLSAIISAMQNTKQGVDGAERPI